MYFFHLFRSFVPSRNPIGFSAIDFIALVCAGLILACLLVWPWIQPKLQWLSCHTFWSMMILAFATLLLRLSLLGHCPVPTPSGSDDFGYLLLGDTLAHFRLANPPHPFSQFFETPFVLQQPTYSSIYPLGQGIVLAIGQLLFGQPWAGVLLSSALVCALSYWMLRGWTSPGWALLGGFLAMIEFGPLSYWTNSYWGGSVAACGGCLVFGSLARLKQNMQAKYAALTGAGIAISLLTRPFESVLLLISVLAYLALMRPRMILHRSLVAAFLAGVAPAILLILAQNRAVTGDWTMMPYQLSRYQYGVPTTFTFQPNPIPHRPLTRQQQLDYEAQAAVHGDGHETLKKYLARLGSRLRIYRFFLLAPLYLAFLAFLATAFRSREAAWIMGTLLLFALGSNFYPFFYPHYLADIACLFVLAAVLGLQQLEKWRLARPILVICAAHFLFWYGLHITAGDDIASVMTRYDPWDYINFGDPEGRVAINRQLKNAKGKQLVFVHYEPSHVFHNWIHNAADIDRAHVVWARDLGPEENQKLLRYFADRTAWILDPDAKPPSLKPYSGETPLQPVR